MSRTSAIRATMPTAIQPTISTSDSFQWAILRHLANYGSWPVNAGSSAAGRLATFATR